MLSPSSDVEAPESFNLETKFIVLNFLSQHPVDGTEPPHCSSSTENSILRENRARQVTSVQVQGPSLLEKRKDFFKRHSEDNIEYKHKKLREKTLSYFSNACQRGVVEENGGEKHGTGRKRTLAELSDEFVQSYMCDADDEYEDSQDNVSGASTVYFMSAGNSLDMGKESHHKHEKEKPIVQWGGGNHQEYDEVDGRRRDEDDVEEDGRNSGQEDESDLMATSSMSISLPSSTNPSNTNLGGSFLDKSKLKLDFSKIQNRGEIALRQEAVASSYMAKLEDEMITLESEYERAVESNEITSALSPFHTPMTPHSEAARFLAKIGDEFKDKYEHQMNLALEQLLNLDHRVTYDEFSNIMASVIREENMPAWTQVTLILMYGQKAAWKIVEKSYQWLGIGKLVDYITQYLTDEMATFIIQQGGWRTIMNFDPSQSSSDSCSNPVTPEYLVHPLTNVMRQTSGMFQVIDSPDAPSQNDTANNNSFIKKVYRLSQHNLEEIPELHPDDGDQPHAPDDWGIDRIFNRPQHPWYHWFTVKEHIGLVCVVFLGIGLSYLFRNN